MVLRPGIPLWGIIGGYQPIAGIIHKRLVWHTFLRKPTFYE